MLQLLSFKSCPFISRNKCWWCVCTKRNENNEIEKKLDIQNLPLLSTDRDVQLQTQVASLENQLYSLRGIFILI